MAERYSKIAPKIPASPRTLTDVLLWAESLTRELERFFRQATFILADKSLISRTHRQLLGAGFTIQPHEYHVHVSSNADVTSDPAAAIELGEDGQVLVIHNHGQHTITIKNAAQVLFAGETDRVLTPSSTVVLTWDEDHQLWIELARTDI